MSTTKEQYGFPEWLDPIYEAVGHRLFDHARHVGNIAICHPYGIDDLSLRRFVHYCDKNNLRFSIAGHSDYHQRAFCLVIWRPKDYRELQQVARWCYSENRILDSDTAQAVRWQLKNRAADGAPVGCES